MPDYARPRSMLAAAAMAVTVIAMAGCSAHVQITGTYAPPAAMTGQALPRPGRVLVYDFSINPAGLQLDKGMRARLQAMMAQSSDPAAKRQQMATEVESAISETLVDAISHMDLNAVAATPQTRPFPGDVIINGQVTRIDAGNQTRRTLIGFGAGKSQVYANVEVSQALPDGTTRLLQTYDANANSGRTPGLGVGAASAAAGNTAMAVAGTVAGTISRARSGLGRDAEDLAKKVATNLGNFFASQGWIKSPDGINFLP